MRLKNYVFFRETDKGVWFDAGRRSFALNGKGIYPLVERLLTTLESSGRSPGQVSADLPEKLRPFAQRLFDELANHDMLQDGILPAAGAGAHEHAAHTEFLKYLEDNLDGRSLRDRLERWREATVAIAGDGFALKAAAGVLADSGCGRIQVHCSLAGDVGPEEIRQSLDDRGDSIVEVTEGTFDPPQGHGIDGLIVAGSDLFPVERAIDHAAYCRDAGIPFCTGLPINGNLAVLAMDGPGVPGLADLADWLLPPADPVTPSPENLAIAGSIAAQVMIDRFFGIGSLEGANARIVSPYSEVSACPIPPSPARHAEGVVVRPLNYGGRIEMPEGRQLSEYELLRMALGPWTDPAVAVLSHDLPDALPQLPLYHDAFMVRRPGTGRDRGRIAVGWGLDAEDAGNRASMNAIAMLAEEEFGADRPLVASGNEERWRAAAFARAFVRHDRFGRDAVWGYLDAAELRDPAAEIVLRILQFQVSSPIGLRIGLVPGIPAVVGACHVDGQDISSVCSPSVSESICEAIGLAVSKIQLRSVVGLVRPEEVALPPRREDAAVHGWEAISNAAGAMRIDVPARYVRSQRLALPETVFCGYAVVDEGA
jgi:hypothetical protein